MISRTLTFNISATEYPIEIKFSVLDTADQGLQHIEGSEPKGPICILAILRKSALKILAMFEVHCRAY